MTVMIDFDFADDSNQRDGRHSHSVMTDEPQRLRAKFVLHFSTCVTKSRDDDDDKAFKKVLLHESEPPKTMQN